MKLAKLLTDSIHKLENSGVESARLDVEIILEHILKRDRTYLMAHDEIELSSSDVKQISALVELRKNRQPLAYILGSKEFFGINFVVNKHILIPRPETEDLVEYVVNNAQPNSNMIDVGTGSGAIAISVAKNRVDLDVHASDVSKVALKQAEINAKNHKVQLNFIVSDVLDNVTPRFDIVAANLPYIPAGRLVAPEVMKEPGIAIFSEDDGLNLYRKLFDQAPKHLKANGQIIIEHEPEQLSAVLKIVDGRYVHKSVSRFVSVFS